SSPSFFNFQFSISNPEMYLRRSLDEVPTPHAQTHARAQIRSPSIFSIFFQFSIFNFESGDMAYLRRSLDEVLTPHTQTQTPARANPISFHLLHRFSIVNFQFSISNPDPTQRPHSPFRSRSNIRKFLPHSG